MSFSEDLMALAREAVQDVRQTFNEVMLDHHEHAPVTPQQATQELGLEQYAARAAAIEPPTQQMEMER